ncbi:MAG: HEAT repeat domain-containing protein [Ekhidna sp.]
MKKDELLHKYYEGKTTTDEEKSLRKTHGDKLYENEMKFYAFSKAQELPDSFDTKVEHLIFHSKPSLLLRWNMVYKIAAAIVLGFFIGYLIKGQENRKIHSEIASIQKTLAIALVDQQSVHLKLKALEIASELPSLEEGLSRSLVNMLNTDESVNIRLAAAETLAAFQGNDRVKAEFLKGLQSQESFLVKAILLKYLISMDDPKIIEELREMIENQPIDHELKGQIQEIIEL